MTTTKLAELKAAADAARAAYDKPRVIVQAIEQANGMIAELLSEREFLITIDITSQPGRYQLQEFNRAPSRWEPDTKFKVDLKATLARYVERLRAELAALP